MFLNDLPFPAALVIFIIAAGVILMAGTRLTRLADRFADLTGWGEAVTGAVVLGAITSLAGSVTSVAAALDGRAELAVSNAVGGIAAQTAFLAIADIVYRKANLEHAAASVANMISGCILIIMLTAVLMTYLTGSVSVLGIHPVTILLFAIYSGGVYLADQSRKTPMWEPAATPDTRTDIPDEPSLSGASVWRLALAIGALGLVTAGAGYAVAATGAILIDKTGLNASIVGTLMTAIATSTPELVTTIAAVRRGALTLAVAGILGGNTFDVLFIAFSDIAYAQGSIYHAITQAQAFVAALGILMTGILLLGLLHRQQRGPGNIGFDGALLLLCYGIGMIVVTRM